MILGTLVPAEGLTEAHYPRKLAGSEISVQATITALVDHREKKARLALV